MRKGIAVSTIIKFLLGLLVLVILAYMVYSIFFAPPLSEADCRAKWVSWCSSCEILGWTGGSNVGAELAACVSTHYGISSSDTNNCGDHQTDCAAFLP